MVAFIIGGIFSSVNIPKESAPEVIIPLGIVSTVLRGANAEDVEKLITNKLEEEIKNATNISKVTSVSREGVSIVTAEFEASADVDTSIQNLKDAVDRAKPKLPSDATEPTITKVNFADQPILILSISQNSPAPKLTELGKTLETELKKVSGVSKVTISGTREKEVNVVIRNEDLTKYGLSQSQIIGAIQGANSSLPVGFIETDKIDYPLKFSASLDIRSQIANIPVTTLGGATIYVRDVATVYDGLESPKTISRISTNGSPSENSLTLSVYKKSGGDVSKIAKSVRDKIEELKNTPLLDGSQVVVTIDNGDQVQKDLKELTRVGFETIVLVMLMLFLTIGWRESLVAGLSIPLSFVIAFIGLYASGNTINFISLFSLILAIGILVDSGIVVAEGIHTRLKLYKTPEEAAIATIKEYSWPLIAGTLTTVAVFAPLFFLSGVVGQFISSIPFTIIFVLIASIVVALGMVPLLAIVLSKEHKSSFEETQERYSELAKEWYKNLLRSILSSALKQRLFLGTLFASFFLALLLPVFGLVKVQFFPQDDQDFLFISIEAEQGTPLSVTDLSVREVEEVLYTSDIPKSFVTTVGASSAFGGDGGSSASKLGNITVRLSPKEERLYTSTEAVELLAKELSAITSAKITVSQGNNGPPSGSPVSISFTSDSLTDLTKAVSLGEDVLKKIDGAIDVTSSMKNNGNQFTLTFDRTKAGAYGISASQIAQILRTSVAGIVATTISTNGEDIDVLVKSNINPQYQNPEETNVTTLDSLKQIPIRTQSGEIVLTGSLITTKLEESLSSISHKDGKRQGTITGNVRKESTAVDIVSEFKKQIANYELPDGVVITYGGENEDVNRTFTEMGIALLIGMTLMLAILVIEFNSFRYSFYLLLAVPLSLIGVFIGLAISGKSLSFSSMLGLVALAGVIVNHAIILLDSVLHNLDREKEKELSERSNLKEVIIYSSALRLRPIFLTTITTVIGMIPLTTVSALWGPLAFTIMFGLSFSMILTLILIPLLFYMYPGSRYQDMK
jgi:multidrug efflux pump subunit AcrB